MAAIEDDIAEAGAEIIWVLEKGPAFEDGTAALCADVMDELGSEDQGWCVGDAQTEPQAGTFDESPFSLDRGFEMIVHRATMEIVFASSHGSVPGNENLSPEEILAAVQEAAQK